MLSLRVSDLEFLAKGFLAFERRQSCRVAYYAGMLAGLHIASEYSRVNIRFPDGRIWAFLMGTTLPVLSVDDFAATISAYTSPDFKFNKAWLTEPQLREGESFSAYSRGMADAVRVAIEQVPEFFREIDRRSWQGETRDWISAKIRWADASLRLEKKTKGGENAT